MFCRSNTDEVFEIISSMSLRGLKFCLDVLDCNLMLFLVRLKSLLRLILEFLAVRI